MNFLIVAGLVLSSGLCWAVTGFGQDARPGGALVPQARQRASIPRIPRQITDYDVERLLEQNDKNKDGKIGKGEAGEEFLSRSFGDFDTNSDGFLDTAELKNTNFRPKGGRMFLDAYDENRDGVLTKDEATHQALVRGFEKFDTDNSGTLSQAEMDEMRGLIIFGKPRLKTDGKGESLLKTAAPAAKPTPTAFKAGKFNEEKWEARQIEGWNLYINKQLIKVNKPVVEAAVTVLSRQLKEITMVVPADAVMKLKTVPLWFSPKYQRSEARAEYHNSAEWLKENGRDIVMAKGVEFTNIPNYIALSRGLRNIPLHELAHAYHDQALGYNNGLIAAAYQRAKAGGKYERVVRQDAASGRRWYDRHYALTDDREYFAESTEAYFSINDFYPFNRKELLAFDPVMFNLLTRLWGVSKDSSK